MNQVKDIKNSGIDELTYRDVNQPILLQTSKIVF